MVTSGFGEKSSGPERYMDQAFRQFEDGYNLFKRRSGQPSMPLVSVSLFDDLFDYRKSVIQGPFNEAVKGGALSIRDDMGLRVSTALGSNGNKIFAYMYTGDLPLTVDFGAFYHEGAEAGYIVVRLINQRQGYNTNVGEFVGNWAIAEMKGDVPEHGLGDTGLRIRTTREYYNIRDKIVADGLEMAMKENLPPGASVPESTLRRARRVAIKHLEDKFGVDVLMPYLKANDLVLELRKTPPPVDPFFKFLVEGTYPADSDIAEVYRQFENG